MKYILLLFIIPLLHCGPKLATELNLVSIQSDSNLRGNEAPWEHDPLYVFDDNSKTAWCADGESGTLSIKLTEPIQIDFLEIVNGMSSSAKASLSNAQVSKLQISAKLEGKPSKDAVTVGVKKVVFEANGKPSPEVLKLDTSLKGDTFELKILESQKGITSLNVCITEIKMGMIKGDKLETYPLKNKSILSDKNKEYDKSKKHYYGWSMFSRFTHGGSLVDFCDIGSCMLLSLSPDGTFTFGDTLPINSSSDTAPQSPNFKKSVTGSYKQESVHPENGVEISFKFYDGAGIETTELWYLKVAKKGDKEYDAYKTMTGENFKLFDSQHFYLLYLESKPENSYHKEMKLFSTAVPLKI